MGNPCSKPTRQDTGASASPTEVEPKDTGDPVTSSNLKRQSIINGQLEALVERLDDEGPLVCLLFVRYSFVIPYNTPIRYCYSHYTVSTIAMEGRINKLVDYYPIPLIYNSLLLFLSFTF